jgi:pimeloyl-ACP methyl ester carboxylesterase
MSEALTIRNRDGRRIAVLIDKPAEESKGVAYILHGLGGFKEQGHIQAMAAAATGEGLVAVRYDARNTIGKSEGAYENASITSYLQDLEDVIQWSRDQPWFMSPFFLAGHSLGGITAGLYAEAHPRDVAGLAPISSVVSGELSMLAHVERDNEGLRQWQATGWLEQPSQSKPGVIKRLKWAEMEDRLRYSLLKDVGQLTMPVLLVVGDQDTVTPWQHQQLQYNLLPGADKRLHIIPGCDHNFFTDEQRAELRQELVAWFRLCINERR